MKIVKIDLSVILVAKLIIKLKSGEVKEFTCKTAEDGHKAIALAVGKYHYFPTEPPIQLEDVADMCVEE